LDEFRLACASSSTEEIAKLCHNDLEYAIFEKFPLIAMMRDHLFAKGALTVHVSGSGSSLFALLPPNRHDIHDYFASSFQDVPSMTMFP
jgi:4-diphosphocytidyl-2-C-methyl-D-erythritol kinase